jgi:hypothetical protein
VPVEARDERRGDRLCDVAAARRRALVHPAGA